MGGTTRQHCYNYQHCDRTGRGSLIDGVTRRFECERYLHREDTGTSRSFGVLFGYDGDTTLKMSDYGICIYGITFRDDVFIDQIHIHLLQWVKSLNHERIIHARSFCCRTSF
jgi:hypothetical protein